MTRPESWETVARALAARLAYQADNCPEGYNILDAGDLSSLGDAADRHVKPEDHPDCPYCSDTAAYRRFLAKVGKLL